MLFVSPSRTCDDNGEGECNNMSIWSNSYASDFYNITHQTMNRFPSITYPGKSYREHRTQWILHWFKCFCSEKKSSLLRGPVQLLIWYTHSISTICFFRWTEVRSRFYGCFLSFKQKGEKINVVSLVEWQWLEASGWVASETFSHRFPLKRLAWLVAAASYFNNLGRISVL